jgi:hypothetical protein
VLSLNGAVNRPINGELSLPDISAAAGTDMMTASFPSRVYTGQ